MAYSGYDGNAYRPQRLRQSEGSGRPACGFRDEHAVGQFAVLGIYFERHTRAMRFGDAIMTYGALALA